MNLVIQMASDIKIMNTIKCNHHTHVMSTKQLISKHLRYCAR